MTPRRVAALLMKWKDRITLFSAEAGSQPEQNDYRRVSGALATATQACLSELEAAIHTDPEETARPAVLETTVLQAVLDAIKGTLDPYTQIADHPNVKFAQMQRLQWMDAARPADFSNHHNALACPYCNPDNLTLAARPAASAVPPWLPIETVPYDFDHEFIIAAWRVGDTGTIDVGEAWRETGMSLWFSSIGNERIYPTHWMPIPDPPQVAEAAAPRPIAAEHAILEQNRSLREEVTRQGNRAIEAEHHLSALQAALGQLPRYVISDAGSGEMVRWSDLQQALHAAPQAPIVDDLHIELARQANALAEEKNGPR